MNFVKLAAAAAIAVSATTATAGGLAPEVMEPMTMEVMEPKSSLGGVIVPAILLALLAVAATAESDSGS